MIAVEGMANKLIAFIKWNGAPFENKKKKIIKEISLIRSFCKECSNGTLTVNNEAAKVAAQDSGTHTGEACCKGETQTITEPAK